MRARAVHEFEHARHGKHDAHAPAATQHLRGALRDLIQRAGRLVARERLLLPRVDEPSARLAVGRIAHEQIRPPVAQQGGRVAQVRAVHADAVRQAVHRDAARGHIRHVRLDLQRVERRAARAGGDEQRQNARARAKVDDMLARPGRGKIRQQHGVRPKAERAGPLQDAQAVVLQVVDALTLARPFLHADPLSQMPTGC